MLAEDGITGCPEIGAGDGESVSGAAGVELSAVDERVIGVEEVDIGCAGSAVGDGDTLRLVVEIREGVPGGTGFLLHLEWPILGV